jgi:mono/diheme cytochrome c family protein
MKVIAFILAVALLSIPAQASTGKELFTQKCSPCHGNDGSADTTLGKAVGAKDLRLTPLTDAQIAVQIHDGKGNMPAFADLKKDEVASLVAYVHELQAKSPVKKAKSKKK